MEEITRILQPHFPGATICFEQDQNTHLINGRIIWAGFRKVGFVERQYLVINPLRAEMGDRADEINMISTYTPQEEKAMWDIDHLTP